jgi:branched-chain amino acid transport system substrate-binding protein
VAAGSIGLTDSPAVTSPARRSSILLAFALAVSLVIAVAACTDTRVATPPTPATAVVTSPSGRDNGEPIRVAWFDAAMPSSAAAATTTTTTSSATATAPTSLPPATRGAQAAVEYINRELGGLGGRPFQLSTCVSKNTSQSVNDCAAVLLDGKPDVVVKGLDDFGSVALSATAGAGLSYVTVQAVSTPELVSPDSLVFTPGTVGYFAGAAQLAADLGWKSVGLALTEPSPAAQSFEAFGRPAFDRLRVAVQGAPVPSEPIGLSKLMGHATEQSPDALVMIGPTAGCTDVLDALRETTYRGPLVLTSLCAVPGVLSDPIVDGAYFLFPDVSVNSADPDTALYMKAMAQYAPDADTVGFAPQGFSAIMDLYRSLLTAPLPGLLNGASIAATLHRARVVPLFMGGGVTFTCDGSTIAVLPAVCSAAVTVARYSGGKWEWLHSYDAARILSG